MIKPFFRGSTLLKSFVAKNRAKKADLLDDLSEELAANQPDDETRCMPPSVQAFADTRPAASETDAPSPADACQQADLADDSAPTKPCTRAAAPPPDEKETSGKHANPAYREPVPFEPRAVSPTISDKRRVVQLKAARHVGDALLCKANAMEQQEGPNPADATVAVVAATQGENGSCKQTGAIAGYFTSENSTRGAYCAVAAALERAGLATCDWAQPPAKRLPLQIRAKASSIPEIAKFCRLPASEPTRMMKPSSNAPKAKLLAEFSKTCRNGRMSSWARAEAEKLADQGTSTVSAVPYSALAAALRLLSAHPDPIFPPIEKRVLSATELSGSKAIDGHVERALALVLQLSGAIDEPDGASTSEVLRRWGVLDGGPMFHLAGDFAVRTPAGAADVGAFGESLCIDSLFFSNIEGADSRSVRCLFIVENKAVFRACARAFGHRAAFAYVGGAWSPESLGALESLAAALGEAVQAPGGKIATFIWFDLDGGGISRARKIKEALPWASFALMDEDDFAAMLAHRSYKLNDGQLAIAYQEAGAACADDDSLGGLARLIAKHGRGVEQEAMLDGYAQGKLDEMLDGDSRALGTQVDERATAASEKALGLKKAGELAAAMGIAGALGAAAAAKAVRKRSGD